MLYVQILLQDVILINSYNGRYWTKNVYLETISPTQNSYLNLKHELKLLKIKILFSGHLLRGISGDFKQLRVFLEGVGVVYLSNNVGNFCVFALYPAIFP